MEIHKIINKNRKKPMFSLDELKGKPGFSELNYNQEEIKKLIPHRDPFLLVDSILGVDLTPGEEFIIGKRKISKDDPIFEGHFPEFPVYPGVLQIEMGGQLGLCLSYFLKNKTTAISENAKPIDIRFTKVLGTHFLAPVLPDKEVTLFTKILEFDAYLGTAISQIISDGNVCSVSVSEVLFLDE